MRLYALYNLIGEVCTIKHHSNKTATSINQAPSHTYFKVNFSLAFSHHKNNTNNRLAAHKIFDKLPTTRIAPQKFPHPKYRLIPTQPWIESKLSPTTAAGRYSRCQPPSARPYDRKVSTPFTTKFNTIRWLVATLRYSFAPIIH